MRYKYQNVEGIGRKRASSDPRRKTYESEGKRLSVPRRGGSLGAGHDGSALGAGRVRPALPFASPAGERVVTFGIIFLIAFRERTSISRRLREHGPPCSPPCWVPLEKTHGTLVSPHPISPRVLLQTISGPCWSAGPPIYMSSTFSKINKDPNKSHGRSCVIRANF